MQTEIKIGVIDFALKGFLFERKLGEGASATAWLVQDAEGASRHVIKIFHKQLQDKDAIMRFHRECKLLSSLRHKNVIHLSRWGTEKGIPWLLLAYEDAVPLNEWFFSNSTPSGDEILQLFKGMCDGLEYVHKQGIVHRDLKPENILIKNDLTPIIIDFGMAKSQLQSTVQTATGMILGTPAYMAPEVISGRAESSPQTDTYALAAILFEMLEGQPLYRGANIVEVVRKVCRSECTNPRRIAQIDQGLAQALVDSLQLDASRRKCTSPSQLFAVLSTAIAGKKELVPSKRTSLPEESQEVETCKLVRSSALLKSAPDSRSPQRENASQAGSDSRALSRRKTLVSLLLSGLILVLAFIAYQFRGKETNLQELASGGNYMALGEAISQDDEYSGFSTNKGRVFLAGKIHAVTILLDSDIQRAFELYLSLWESSVFCRSGFHKELFSKVSSVLPLLSFGERLLLDEKIAQAVYYESESHSKEALSQFSDYLDRKDEVSRVSLRIHGFIDACFDKRYPFPGAEGLFSEAMNLLGMSKDLCSLPVDTSFFAGTKTWDAAYLYLKKSETRLQQHMPEIRMKQTFRGDADALVQKYLFHHALACLSCVNVWLFSERIEVTNHDLPTASLKRRWKYLAFYLGKDGESTQPPLISSEVFGERELNTIVQTAYLCGDSHLALEAGKQWILAAPNHHDGGTRLNDYMLCSFAGALDEDISRDYSSIEAAMSDKAYISSKVKELKMWTTAFDTTFSLVCNDDVNYALAALFSGFAVTNIPHKSVEFFSRFLSKIKGKPLDTYEVVGAIKCLLFRRTLQKWYPSFVQELHTYANSLDRHPLQRAFLILDLLSAELAEDEVWKILSPSEPQKQLLLRVGSRLKGGSTVRVFSELRNFSPEQLAKAAVLNRVGGEYSPEGESSVLVNSWNFSVPQHTDASLQKRWAFMVGAMITKSSYPATRRFVLDEYPSLRAGMKFDEVTGYVLHPYILSLILRKGREIPQKVRILTREQVQVADSLSAFVTAHRNLLDRHLFLSICHRMFQNISNLERLEYAKGLPLYINLLESFGTSEDSLLRNRALLALGDAVGNHYSDIPQTNEETLDNVYLVRPMLEKAISVYLNLYRQDQSTVPGDRWRFIYTLGKALLYQGKNKAALGMLNTFPLEDVPIRMREPWLRVQIENHLKVLNILKAEEKNDLMEEEIKKVYVISQKYGEVSGAMVKFTNLSRNSILALASTGVLTSIRH